MFFCSILNVKILYCQKLNTHTYDLGALIQLLQHNYIMKT